MLGLGALEDCKPCPGGWYCSHYGASEPTNKCDSGYFCEFGMDRPRPTGTQNITGENGTCIMNGAESFNEILIYEGFHFPWILWKLVLPSHFISWKINFLILAGSGFNQIWLLKKGVLFCLSKFLVQFVEMLIVAW